MLNSFVTTFVKKGAVCISTSETNKSHVDLQLSISLLNRKSFTDSPFLCVMDEYDSLVVVKRRTRKRKHSSAFQTFAG
jgi:hypothetical protein